MKHCKYLIIGGGVSGLTFANYINNKDYVLIEKEKELGGYCRTIYQDGYIWDYAGHFFHFATDEIKSLFKDKINDNELIFKEKCTKIFYKNLVIDFPFQANIHQLDKSEFIECLYDLYFRKKNEDQEKFSSFLDMLYGKFGISITEKFLKPYNEKLYACDLNMLDQNAMGRFFPYANIDQVIKNFKGGYEGSYNSEFMYPKKGAKVFVDALAENVDRNKICLDQSIVDIDTKNKIAKTNTGQEISYEFLINTSPLNLFLNTFEGYSDFAKGLSWNKVLVLNLGFSKKSKFQDIHWAYIPSKDTVFYRVGFYDNILGQDRLSMYVEIGLGPKDKVPDIDAVLQQTLEDLQNLDIIDDANQLMSYSVIVMDPAYVHVDSKLESMKSNLMKDLEKIGIYSIGRYGDWKYCSIEDSMIDAVKLAKALNEKH